MLLEHRSNENQMRRLPRKPLWQLRTWAVRASWVEVSGSDCECGEGGEHSKRWQFWWEMMHDGSQRFCDRSKVISNLDRTYLKTLYQPVPLLDPHLYYKSTFKSLVLQQLVTSPFEHCKDH